MSQGRREPHPGSAQRDHLRKTPLDEPGWVYQYHPRNICQGYFRAGYDLREAGSNGRDLPTRRSYHPSISLTQALTTAASFEMAA